MGKGIDERLRFEMLISDLSARFVKADPEEISEEVNRAIQQILEFFDVDEIVYGEFSEEEKGLVTVFSHSRSGNPHVPRRFNKPLPFPWYVDQLRSGKTVRLSADSLPKEAGEPLREYVRKWRFKSNLSVPVAISGSTVCVISLDSFRSSRVWPDALAARIRLLGEIIANTLVRARSEKKVRGALETIKQLKKEIEVERDYLREEVGLQHDFEGIVGESQALQEVLCQVELVAPTESTVLILGETGTGKELIARAIHSASSRKDGPFVKLNCAALPSSLIESELFGHERGAFTGAHTRRLGRFEVAREGTLFLDEVGEFPFDLQAKLLRVIEEGAFERLGSSRTIRADVRLLTATNRNLEEEVRRGGFREDLWYRLSVYPITVPPLRDRKEDIAFLVNWFIEKLNRKLGTQIKKIPSKAMKVLENYSWPGNVRELENVIERSVIGTSGSVFRLLEPFASRPNKDSGKRPAMTLAQVERDHIVDTLEQVGGKIYGEGGAASILGLHPETLRSRMRKIGIKKRVSKQP